MKMDMKSMKEELKTLQEISSEKGFEEFLAKERMIPLEKRFHLYPLAPKSRPKETLRAMELLQKIFLMEKAEQNSLDVLLNKYDDMLDKRLKSENMPSASKKALIYNVRTSGFDWLFDFAMYSAEMCEIYKKRASYSCGDDKKNEYLGYVEYHAALLESKIIELEVLLTEQKFGIDNNYTLEQYIADRNAAKKEGFIQNGESSKKPEILFEKASELIKGIGSMER
jgi:hypothetical protein